MPLYKGVSAAGNAFMALANGPSSQVFCGKLLSANMNSTADQAIPIILPTGFTRWRLNNIFAIKASISLTTAVGGVYPAASKAGTALVANTQAYSGLTAAADNATGGFLALTAAAGITNTIYDLAAIYLSLTTPQGAAATADFYVNITPFP